MALDRLRSVPGRDRRLERRADLRARLDRRGEGPRARAPDGRAPGRVPHARPDRDLGDPRPRLARAGEEGGGRRADRGRAVPADLLPLPRPGRGDGPRGLRRLPLRGDPPLQRDADAAGHRRPRADIGGGRRREHRHLRTHQGRGARRTLRARGDSHRLYEGLPHDRRRERRHGDHRDGAVRSRDRERARLRADAARRYRDLDADRGARDARLPGGARRPADARQPAPDGRCGGRHPALAEGRLHRQAAAVVRDLGRRRR